MKNSISIAQLWNTQGVYTKYIQNKTWFYQKNPPFWRKMFSLDSGCDVNADIYAYMCLQIYVKIYFALLEHHQLLRSCTAYIITITSFPIFSVFKSISYWQVTYCLVYIYFSVFSNLVNNSELNLQLFTKVKSSYLGRFFFVSVDELEKYL